MLTSFLGATEVIGAGVVVIAVDGTSLAGEVVVVFHATIAGSANVIVVATDACDFPFDYTGVFALFTEVIAPTCLAWIGSLALDRFTVSAGTLGGTGFPCGAGIAVGA